ncbi:unnamed protein product [Musa hybrid cultivar]
MALFTPSGLVMQKDLLTSSDRSTRCHQASIFSHSTSSVENLLFLRAHPLDDVSESQQFVPDILNGIFEIAIEMEKIEKNSLRSKMLEGYLMVALFESSTSTRLSFEPAIKRFGGEIHFAFRYNCSHFKQRLFPGDFDAPNIIACCFASIFLFSNSSAKLEVVVLEGDFSNEDNDDWTEEEFDSHVVKEREGKRPLLIGDLYVSWKEGIGTLGELTFPDNSSWIRSRKFRLGLKIASGFCDGIRVREAKTEAFTERTTEGNWTRNTIHLN